MAAMKDPAFGWSNSNGVDLSKPYLYVIRVSAGTKEYRYVGKGSRSSRMNAYAKNVARVLAGETKRPALKKDGQPQSQNNVKFRYIHLVLAEAVRRGWKIEHYPIENCEAADHTAIEQLRMRELDCNTNNGRSWFVEDFDALAKDL